jgi:hypothetical protein
MKRMSLILTAMLAFVPLSAFADAGVWTGVSHCYNSATGKFEVVHGNCPETGGGSRFYREPEAPPPPPPPPPRILNFGGLQYLPRCDRLEFNQGDKLQDLLTRLRTDAFAPALDVYIHDLENVVDETGKFIARLSSLNSRCHAYNVDAWSFDQDALDWNQSNCVSGVEEQLGAGCAAKREGLRDRRSTLQGAYQNISNTDDGLVNYFAEIDAKAEPAIRNAILILKPENTEQVLRLYIWHVLRMVKRGETDSCRGFAQIAQALGKRVKNQGTFLTYLTRNVMTNPGPASYIIPKGQPADPISGFSSSGFKKKFLNTEGQTKNLIRHTAAHLLTGYELRASLTPNQIITYFRDKVLPPNPENGDYYLALAAGELGWRLRHKPVSTADFGDNMLTQFCTDQ